MFMISKGRIKAQLLSREDDIHGEARGEDYHVGYTYLKHFCLSAGRRVLKRTESARNWVNLKDIRTRERAAYLRGL